MNGSDQSTAGEIATAIATVSPTILQWYSTITQRPIAPAGPPSMMRNVLGADLGAGATPYGQLGSPVGVVLTIGVVGVVLVLLLRR